MTKSNSISVLPIGTTFDQMDSPAGILTLITSVQGLHAILWDCDIAQAKCENTLKKPQGKFE